MSLLVSLPQDDRKRKVDLSSKDDPEELYDVDSNKIELHSSKSADFHDPQLKKRCHSALLAVVSGLLECDCDCSREEWVDVAIEVMSLSHSGNPIEFKRSVSSLISNMRRNGQNLLGKDPKLVPFMTPDVLAEGSEIIEKREERRKKLRQPNTLFKSIENIKEDELEGFKKMCCVKCKGDVKYNTFQIGGGDEPMTVRVQCMNPKCNHVWKSR
jgi:DNA-directed RNA polymerase subunit M/transcription elongation factor TFIIS